ncbi:tRNA pseudouridine(13) synthase TruD [Acidithiobacillus sp. AMEEHan]|uniref:tRNA pseudouridine(13) synthase TruD n=1 Tax=Acidithiobacillus sp. AMEEHan TaxID=2994951 RepID=UPI0027E3C333|nr:tRNA pseudouridine(13) synthase TruD [Acidithiobacillus sp. AMEEHan]
MSEIPERYYPELAVARPIGVFRSSPETFFVEELLPFAADGEGDHAWLWIEKTQRHTEEVARLLARYAGVPARDVGYAGLKDYHACTRQAFTVPLAGREEPDWGQFAAEGVQILAIDRHRRKLRRGVHRGNRFQIHLHEAGDFDAWENAMQALAQQGFPNYFGAQRFGRDNLPAAGRLLADGRRGRMPHHLRALLWSTARSTLFNVILAERVRQKSWNRILPGEIIQLAGSHSQFRAGAEELAELQARAEAWDLHPTGPLPGKAAGRSKGLAGELEAEILANWSGGDDSPGNGMAWAAALANQGLDAARRALRCRPQDVSVHAPQAGDIVLKFSLPQGSYATVLLEALGVKAEK